MPKTISAFTTMNREIYDRCGKDMIDSFAHYSEDIPLTVYVEGFVLPAEYHDKVNQVPLSQTHFNRFKEMCEPYPERSGLIDDVTRIGRPASWTTQIENGQPYHFRLDAVKFSRKVFCLYHFAHETDADIVLLMDADTGVLKPVTSRDLLTLFPDGNTIALLKRDHEYSEAGFYMVDLKNGGREFIDHFAGLYLTGDVFGLREWHDSYVLDRAIEQTGVKSVSISGKGSATNHPLQNGPLGKWFYHEKGRFRRVKYKKARA